MFEGTYSSLLSSDSSEDEVEGDTLAQLNKEKKRGAWELKDDAHEDEDEDGDSDASVSSAKLFPLSKQKELIFLFRQRTGGRR